MREELTQLGFAELKSAEEVDGFMSSRSGSSLLLINSVCGCAAGQARPGVAMALQHAAKPESVVTVFAGQDVEATARAREHFADIPPSSPSIALFEGDELVYFIPRHRIEGRTAQEVAEDLTGAFERYFASADA